MKHTRMRTKKAKAYCIVDMLRDGELCATATLKKNLTGSGKRFPVIPCTITYTITNPRSRTK